MAPGWKVWLFTVISGVIASVTSVYVSVRMADQNTREILARTDQATATQRAESVRAACDLVSRILAAYEEDPPVSQTGRNVVDAWRDQYRRIGCTPKR